ncbi:MAG: hypothetical protein F4Y96_00050 [Chloroflexi bacterium]|nr:hypothetical protein [Chloroflexota bacterium]
MVAASNPCSNAFTWNGVRSFFVFSSALAFANSGHSFQSGNGLPSMTQVSTPVTSLRCMTGMRERNGASR